MSSSLVGFVELGKDISEMGVPVFEIQFLLDERLLFLVVEGGFELNKERRTLFNQDIKLRLNKYYLFDNLHIYFGLIALAEILLNFGELNRLLLVLNKHHLQIIIQLFLSIDQERIMFR